MADPTARPTTTQLDCVSDAPISLHTHTPDEARPLVEADTRQWLDDAGFTDVTFEVQTVFGPGGGASVINFTAPTYLRLRELVTHYVGGPEDQHEIDYQLGLVD